MLKYWDRFSGTDGEMVSGAVDREGVNVSEAPRLRRA